MSPFDTEILIFPSIVIFLVIFTITLVATKSLPISFVCSVFKTAIFFLYFGFFFDGIYTFFDDISYLEGGYKIHAREITPFNFLNHVEYLQMIAGGEHYGYYLYNAFTIAIFGDYYFSPVVFNIIITAFISLLGSRLFNAEFNLSVFSYRSLYLFLLFHPDILAWSSITNIKDVIVLLFHVVLLYAGSDFLKGDIKNSLIKSVPSFIVLYTLRFYVPILIAFSLIATLIISKRIKTKFLLLPAGVGVIGLIFGRMGTSTLFYHLQELRNSMTNPISGVIRALMTPVPFNTSPEYEFLNLPALFHWMMLPVMILGILRLWKLKSSFSIFILTYFSIFIMLYGFYEELQGPRHRLQLDYAIAIFQFTGVFVLFNLKKITPKF